MVLILKNETQISAYLNENKSIILDFYAEWCPPCRKFMLIFDKVSSMPEYKEIIFIKVNIDEFAVLAGNYKITSIPSLIFIKKGDHKNAKKITGMKGLDYFLKDINKFFF